MEIVLYKDYLDRSFLKIETAFMILKRGGYILINDKKGNAALMKASEFSDLDDGILKNYAKNKILCLTSLHLKSFGKKINNDYDCYSFPANNLNISEIVSMILGEKNNFLKNINFLGEKSNSLPDLSCKILKSAKLIPASILVRLNFKNPYEEEKFIKNFQIPNLNFSEILKTLNQNSIFLYKTTEAKLPLLNAPNAKIVMFRQSNGKEEHFAIVIGKINKNPPIVRIHSQCVTGDILSSLKCDCGNQLNESLKVMYEANNGILLYLAQEGRDIGLLNKIRAYALQDNGLDTVEANHRLGFETDERVFTPAASMLFALKVTKIKLLTNNPDKISQLRKHKITVTERIPLIMNPTPYNKKYLNIKKTKTKHMME